MKYPITVNKIEFDKSDLIQEKVLFGEVGDMVSIRPCADEYKNKTFLGILLGELPLGYSVSLKEGGILIVRRSSFNPAIFVPDINKTIFGCESWWGVIKDEKQLKEITDKDINNVWYVKALKGIEERKRKENEN